MLKRICTSQVIPLNARQSSWPARYSCNNVFQRNFSQLYELVLLKVSMFASSCRYPRHLFDSNARMVKKDRRRSRSGSNKHPGKTRPLLNVSNALKSERWLRKMPPRAGPTDCAGKSDEPENQQRTQRRWRPLQFD